MKVAFVVLLMSAVAMAGWLPMPSRVGSYSAEDPDCEVAEDCTELCGTNCVASVDAMCVDGSCMCKVDAAESRRRRIMAGGWKRA